jgi:predicted permease
MKNKHKKIEFSKKWLIGCIAISLIFTAASYVLAFFDKNPVSELSIAIVEVMWGTSGVSFVGYVIQNSVRAFTASKFGIPEKRGEPGGKQKKSETSGAQPDCR